MSLKDRGRIVLPLSPAHPDWRTNRNGYRLPFVRFDDVSVEAAKHPDGTLEVTLLGALGANIVFLQPTPVPTRPDTRLTVLLRWGDRTVQLSLDGVLVDTKQIPDPA